MEDEKNRTPDPTLDPLELSSGSCRSVNSPEGKRRKMASSSQPPSSSEAQWPYDYERTFVGFMYEAVTRGTLVGNKFSSQQWIKLACKMRGKFPGTSYTVPQLRGKYDRLKSRWKRYHRLLTVVTGFGWDASTGTITASNKTWAFWIQSNPSDQQLQQKDLPIYKELTAIFAPTTATGNMARSSSQARGRATAFDRPDDDGGTPLINPDGYPSDTTPSPELRRRRVVSPSSSNRRRKLQDREISSFVESYTEANNHIKKVVVDEADSYEVAIDTLTSMGDLPAHVFYKAFENLVDSARRRLFNLLKDDFHRRAVVYGWAGKD